MKNSQQHLVSISKFYKKENCIFQIKNLRNKILCFILLTHSFIIGKAQTWTNYTTGVFNNYVTPSILKMVMDTTKNIYAICPKDSIGVEYVAKWNGTIWTSMGTVCSAANNNVDVIKDIDIDNNEDIYIAAHLYGNNVTQNQIFKWGGSNWVQVGNLSTIMADNQPYVMTIECVNSNEIYCGGFFRNDSNKCFVAKWNGTTWSELGKINANNAIEKILKSGTDEQGQTILLATGLFTNQIGKPFVAKYENGAWSAVEMPNSKLENHSINIALAASKNGEIYVAGYADTGSYYVVSSWKNSKWENLVAPTVAGYGWWQRSMALDNYGNLYIAGGRYDSVLFNESCVLAYSNHTWSEVGGYKSFYEKDDIYSMIFDKDNCLYAIGNFTNGAYRNFVKQICNLSTNTSETPTQTNIKMYPNPADNYFTFYTNNLQNNYTVNIYTMQGKLIKKAEAKAHEKISIEDLSKGLYLVEFKNDKEQFVEKLQIK